MKIPARLWRYLPATLCVLVITLASLLPARLFADTAPRMAFPGADKLVHMCMYAVLAGTLFYGLPPTLRLRKVHLVLSILGAAFYGLFVEIAQAYCTTSRAFELSDALANLLGAALGGVLVYKLYARHTKPITSNEITT